MTLQELTGTYNITGRNQDAETNIYKGILSLTIDNNNRIHAKWVINNNQEQIGYGFFKNDILVINFKYKSEDNKTYKGVVVYKCITKDLLDGFWSEKYGNPLFLGEECCFRVETQKELIN